VLTQKTAYVQVVREELRISALQLVPGEARHKAQLKRTVHAIETRGRLWAYIGRQLCVEALLSSEDRSMV